MNIIIYMMQEEIKTSVYSCNRVDAVILRHRRRVANRLPMAHGRTYSQRIILNLFTKIECPRVIIVQKVPRCRFPQRRELLYKSKNELCLQTTTAYVSPPWIGVSQTL